ncbi:MAG TPA: T9SS type A sorting domain-containing protein, partial [Candidatus Krumholzibacterium sp.]|nr:T9SS type A sorting domain-containing protein [Candidatus Krumholzibacterium sp.]
GDSMGGAIVVWEHWDGDSDIYSKHIGSDGQVLATEVAGFSAEASADGIEIRWTMSESEEGMVFSVSRSGTGDGYYSVLDGPVEETDLSGYRYLDTTAGPGQDYIYRVSVTDSEGTKMLFETGPLTMPVAETVVRQNYPNPFNPVTTISYDLAGRSAVEISVFDVSGRKIAVLAKGIEDGGRHAVVWNGCDDSGARVVSGVYFYRLRAGKEVFTRKMILLR